MFNALLRRSPPATKAGDAVYGVYIDGSGAMTPVTTKSFSGGSGMSLQSQIRARKELRADDTGLALAIAANPTVYRCVDLRSRKVADMPRKLVNKKTKETVDDHPFLDALKLARQMYHKDLFYVWEHARCVHGEVYIEKVGDQFGRAATLRWLNPLAIEPYVDRGVIQWFEYSGDDGQLRLTTESVVYDYYHNPLDDFRGLSPVQVALRSVNISIGVEDYQNAFFQNEARPGGILSARQGTAINQADSKRLMNFFLEQVQGARKAFRTIFMPAALEWQSVQQAPSPEHDTVDRGAARKICTALGVPVTLIDQDEMRFQLSEEQPKAFYDQTIIPECEDIQTVINDDLLPFFDDSGDVEFTFDYDRIRALMDDQVKRATAINSRMTAGNITINEARQKFGDAPIEGGDVFLIPKAGQPVKVEDLGKIDELVTETPEGQGQPQEDSVPRREGEQNELKLWRSELSQWKKVTFHKGIARGRGFKAYALPVAVAGAIRADLTMLPDDAGEAAIKAVFVSAERQLSALLDDREDEELRKRLSVIHLERLFETPYASAAAS